MDNRHSFALEGFTGQHWQLLSYVEDCVVNKGGSLDSDKLFTRQGAFRFPNGEIVPNYSELDALEDFKRVGLIELENLAAIRLTPLGWQITGLIRRHIAEVGSLGKFELAPLEDSQKAAYQMAYRAVTVDWLTTIEDLLNVFGIRLETIGNSSYIHIMTMSGADTWNLERESPQVKALVNLLNHCQVATHYLAENPTDSSSMTPKSEAAWVKVAKGLIDTFKIQIGIETAPAGDYGAIQMTLGDKHLWPVLSNDPAAVALMNFIRRYEKALATLSDSEVDALFNLPQATK